MHACALVCFSQRSVSGVVPQEMSFEEVCVTVYLFTWAQDLAVRGQSYRVNSLLPPSHRFLESKSDNEVLWPALLAIKLYRHTPTTCFLKQSLSLGPGTWDFLIG